MSDPAKALEADVVLVGKGVEPAKAYCPVCGEPLARRETVWLIERTLEGRVRYLALHSPDNHFWTINPHKAHRFQTKADAETWINGAPDLSAHEHIFATYLGRSA